MYFNTMTILWNFLGLFYKFFITFEPNSWFLYEPDTFLLIFELDILNWEIVKFGQTLELKQRVQC